MFRDDLQWMGLWLIGDRVPDETDASLFFIGGIVICVIGMILAYLVYYLLVSVWRRTPVQSFGRKTLQAAATVLFGISNLMAVICAVLIAAIPLVHYENFRECRKVEIDVNHAGVDLPAEVLECRDRSSIAETFGDWKPTMIDRVGD